VARRSAARSAQTESFSLTSFDGFGLDDAIARVIAEEKCVSRGAAKESPE
jgi:hypothetical protein